VHAFGLRQYDWQGLVVLGTVLCLKIDTAAHSLDLVPGQCNAEILQQ
jgi:hypothetical protein